METAAPSVNPVRPPVGSAKTPPPLVLDSAASIEAEMSASVNKMPRIEAMGMGSVTICSIYPLAMESEPMPRAGHGAWRYKIAAGSVKNPAYLTIDMTWDQVINQAAPVDQAISHMAGYIPAAVEAAALVRHWAGDHPMNRFGKIGIGIIAGTVATPEELKALEKGQQAFLKAIVNGADQNWQSADPKKIAKIGPEARRAFELLNLDPKLHRWYSNTTQINLECPWCSTSVLNTAIFCTTCRNSITDYFIERDLDVDPEKWPRVAEDVEMKKKKLKKAS